MEQVVNDLSIELLKSPLIFIPVTIGLGYIIYRIVIIFKKNKNNLVNESANTNIEDNICPQCGEKLILREGKYGKFYGCSGYPNCKYTKKID